VTLRDVGKIVEFTPSGKSVREISLQKELVHPRHAIQLAPNKVLLCHGYGNGPYGICIVGTDGKTIKVAEVPAGSKTFSPTHLAIDGKGLILATDFYGNRVVKFDGELKYKGEAVSEGVKNPFRLCLEQTSDRLFVGEYSATGRVVFFNKY